MTTAILILTILATALVNGFAQQAGDLDSTFGRDGMVTTDFGIGDDVALSAAIQPDGKIVAAGYSGDPLNGDFSLARYHSNGTLDLSFGTGGKLITHFDTSASYASSVAIQPDGKIVAAGFSGNVLNGDFCLARYNADGTLDNSFSYDGKVTLDFWGDDDKATSIAIQPDGKIIAAGFASIPGIPSWAFALVRYNPDGTLDSGFGANGKVTTDFHVGIDDGARSVAIQPDGKIIAAGYAVSANPNFDFAIARYNPDGTLDSSFSTIGMLTTDFDGFDDAANSIAIQPDGKIVAAGTSDFTATLNTTFFALARYSSDGSLDTSFSADGKLTSSFGVTVSHARSLAIQPDGKIVAAGFTNDGTISYDFALARYNTNGALDNNFGTNGNVITDLGGNLDQGISAVIDSDGKIVVAGRAYTADDDFALVRYLSGLTVGILSFSPAENILIYPNPILTDEVLEYSLQQDEALSIGLYDINGKLIKQFITNEKRSKGAHKESLHFGEALPSGSYVLRIANDSGSMGVKLLKQ